MNINCKSVLFAFQSTNVEHQRIIIRIVVKVSPCFYKRCYVLQNCSFSQQNTAVPQEWNRKLAGTVLAPATEMFGGRVVIIV